MNSVTIKEMFFPPKAYRMGFLSFVKKTFSFDERSLALYRVLMGIIVIVDVLYRWPDLMNFYTDIGILPRSIFVSELAQPWSFSLHLANGSYGFAVAIFSLHLLFGLMMVFGLKTRWAVLGAFVMTASVHNRNWMVNNGGDDIMRAILFLSIFLPLNRCFSVDAAMKTEREKTSGESFSTWNLAFFFQVFAIYFVSYILKDDPMWRRDYTAVFMSSLLDIFATPLGFWLRKFSWVHRYTNIFTIFLEWLGTILLVFSFAFGKRLWWWVRIFVVLAFWALHLGIILMMWIGVFPYLCLAMWTIFIPGPLWDKIMGWFRKKGFGEVTIYFDQECGFCKKTATLIREFFLLPEVPIVPAQSDSKIESVMKEQVSWVVVNGKGERFTHFNAFVELMRHSPLLRPFVTFFRRGPLFALGGAVYHWVSHHRSFMGKATQYLEWHTAKKKIKTLSWLNEALGAFVLVTLLVWNLTTIKKLNFQSPFFQGVTRWIHLYQEWNMFAPYPKLDNVWIEVPAVLSDGSEMEIITGDRDIYGVKDQQFYQAIPNEHWRKFYLNLSERVQYAKYYGGFLCRLWNDRHEGWVKDVTLRKMEIVVYSQRNRFDGTKEGISRKQTWKHWCFDEDYKKDNEEKK